MNDLQEFDLSTEFEVYRITKNSYEPQIQQLAKEVPFSIIANDIGLAGLMCSPADLKELTFGFLFTSGFIKSPSDVLAFQLDQDNWTARINLKETPEPEKLNRRMYTAGCGKGVIYFDEQEMPERPPLEDSLSIGKDAVFDLMKWFQASGGVHQRIRGTHTAALSLKGNNPSFGYDDVGRHNAVDKVIGRALLENIGLGECILLSSGRVSTEIIHKAIKAGLPIILSIGTPTHHAILLAKTMNVTLIGSARAGSFSIYTNRERVQL
jgi:FdhD protein